jgi:F-type H+-transporting ATPase subunit gamma
MVENIERTQERLENIRTAEPLLGALRTVSMGSWHSARNQKRSVQRYAVQLQELLPWLVPQLPTRKSQQPPQEQKLERVVALLLGSERGMCGRFNRAIVEYGDLYLNGLAETGIHAELWVVGSRAIRLLERRKRRPDSSQPLPVTGLPPYRLADDLTHRWLARFEAGQLDRVDVLYNAYRGVGQYRPQETQLIPPRISLQAGTGEFWPPPIVETEPLGLFAQIVRQLTAINLYDLLLESATAEHSARYQLMEEATQNAERLLQELMQDVQAARRHAITQEMLQLVTGAGLLGSQYEEE